MQVLAMEYRQFAMKQVPKWWKISDELGYKYAVGVGIRIL